MDVTIDQEFWNALYVIQIPLDGSASQHHPAICVTNVMGDEFKLVFTENMEQWTWARIIINQPPRNAIRRE